MINLKVEDVFLSENYQHIDVFVFDIPVGPAYQDAKFKIYATNEGGGLEFRVAPGWPQMFVRWPSQTQDSFGPVFRMGLGAQLEPELRNLHEADKYFIQCLIDQLPNILEIGLSERELDADVIRRLTGVRHALTEQVKAIVGEANPFGPSGESLGTRPHARLRDKPTPPVDALIRAQMKVIALRGHFLSTLDLGFENLQLISNALLDRSCVLSRVVDRAIRLSLPTTPGWIRVLSSLQPAGQIARQRLSLLMKVFAVGPPVKADRFGLGSFDRDGRFHVVHLLSEDRRLPSKSVPFVLSASRAALARSFAQMEPDAPVFFFIEFSKSADIEYTPPTRLEENPTGADIPYNNSELATCERLIRLNRELRAIEPQGRVDWLISTAEVAYRMECLETAAALAKQIAPMYRGLSRDLRGRFLRLFVAIGFAEGRNNDVANILLANIELTHANDDLFTALSLCLKSDEPGGYFDTLPSGKVNRAYLSNLGAASKALHLLRKTGSGQSGLQTQLLAASLLRTASPSLYLDALNRFLTHYRLAPLLTANCAGPNTLQTFRFAAAPDQPAGRKVSVIMSVYNAVHTVSYAIRSILEQNYPNFELLICDDCSTDGSVAEIAKWRHDSRVMVYRSVASQGPYNIRNGLISEASGAYITFQDADDLAHPERLSRQVRALEGSSASALFARWLRIRPDGTIVFFRDHLCHRMSAVSLMVRAEAFKKHGHYRTVLCGADIDFLERLRVELGPDGVLELDVPLLFGLWSSNSLTRQPGLESLEDGFRSKARRAFAEITGRQRLLGAAIVPESEVNRVMHEAGIYRSYQGVNAWGREAV